MKVFFFFLMLFVSITSAWDCQDCRDDLEKCKESSDNAFRQGRVGHPCDPSRCDYLCQEESKKNRGIATDAEKLANERFNSEQGLRSNLATFYSSLTKNEKIIYDNVVAFLNGKLDNVQSNCFDQSAQYMGYGLNDNFTINFCVIRTIRSFLYEENQQAFVNLMSDLEIPQQYWKAANGGIHEVIGSLTMRLY